MTAWSVPGYDVLELLGFGSSGELWRARERGSGHLVVLRRLAGGDRDLVARARTEATVVRSLPSPHLVRLRTTARSGRDDVLVLEHAEGGSLAALLTRRGTLTPGEVVTVLAPLAEVLAQAHAHDLVHGRLRPSCVLLSGDGRPLLDGLGLSGLHEPDDTLDPTGGLGVAADVWGLGALGHRLLTGQEPGADPLGALAPTVPLPLVRALEAALAFDPATRPTAADLAAALLSSCPAAPLQGLAPPDLPDLPAARRRLPALPLRRLLVGAVAALALTGVAVAGQAWGRQAVAPVGPAAVPAAWQGVLEQLDATRSEAFRRGDASLLDGVYVAGSAALAADRATLADLVARHESAEGVRHLIGSVTLRQASGDSVRLEVRGELSPYAVSGPTGVTRHAGGSPTRHEVVLARTEAGWRIAVVLSRPLEADSQG